MSAAEGDEARLAGRFGEEAHNVLLLAPPMDRHTEDGCADLMARHPPAAEDVLYVTAVQSADQRIEAWRTGVGDELPASMGIVDVGGSMRSEGAAVATDGSGDVRVLTVSSPGNLTDLGIKVSTFLSEWESADARIVACVHSLTALLQYADVQRVFRFLHVLTGRVRSVGGFAHYHMDPSAHDRQTVNTLLTLFDGVAEWEAETGWSVRSR